MGAKRQHFFPKQMQKNFLLVGEEKLWVYDRQANEYRHSYPKDIAVEGHLYSFMQPELESQRFALEEAFAKLEDKAAPAFIRLQNQESLTQKERNSVCEYVAFQTLRVPQQMSATKEMIWQMTQSINQEMLADIDAMSDEYFAKELSEIGLSANDLTKKNIHDAAAEGRIKMIPPADYHLSAMVEAGTDLSVIFSKRHWRIVHAPAGTSFIGSDYPVIRQAQKNTTLTNGNGPGSPGIVNLFPFSKSTALMILDDEMPIIEHFKFSKKGVKAVNSQLAQESERIIFSHSKKLLESLAKKNHLNQFRSTLTYYGTSVEQIN